MSNFNLLRGKCGRWNSFECVYRVTLLVSERERERERERGRERGEREREREGERLLFLHFINTFC